MRRTIYCLLAFVVCINIFVGCSKNTNDLSVSNKTVTTHATEEPATIHATEEPATIQATEKPAVTQATEAPATTQATEAPATTQATEETEDTQATEEVRDYEFCSTCGIWYEGMNLVNGQCEYCRNGLCFLCKGPDGPNHNCDDYPNVICPNPDCDWGMFTTGVGIDGIICPKCGTRCV